MMDGLREEALRIKAKLAAEREEERRKAEEAAGVGSRKIAQPKGQAGRFSDVHMAEFKKMDSIAGHPSSFRAQPARFAPAANSLKRTQSKAQLNEDGATKSLKRTQSKARLGDPEDVQNSEQMVVKSDRMENTAPVKRARKHLLEDASSARPVSRHESQPEIRTLPVTPTAARFHSTMFSAVTTPTQASLARAATTKKTQIPTLSRSSSKPNLISTPRGMTKSVSVNNLRSLPEPEPQAAPQTPGKFDRVKSMFGYGGMSAKKPTTKPSAIPSLSRSPSKPNLEKPLPSVPVTPGAAAGSRVTKHVNFTPNTVNKNSVTVQKSPSPIKSGIPRSTSKIELGPRPTVKLLPSEKVDAMEVEYPSIADLPSLGASSKTVVEYPSLSGVRPLPEPPRQAPPPPPSVPGTFTFRHDHTINFGTSPKGFGSSPGQASVRQVRQSVLPNKIPGSFPRGNKENKAPLLPTVPHGMANKKRRRVESDDDQEEEDDRSPKKHKTSASEGHTLLAPTLHATPKSQNPSPVKKRGVLSLSRLNMLSRPKNRK